MIKFKDITGNKIGSMTAISRTADIYQGTFIWNWQCDCGNLVKATRQQMNYKKFQCQKCNDVNNLANKLDITNLKVGSMTAISATDEKEGTHIIWRWKCDCGYETLASHRQMKICKKYKCQKCLEASADTQINKNNLQIQDISYLNYKRDITGLKIGTMTAITSTKKIHLECTVWKWQCDCGEIVNATKNQMKYKKNHCSKCNDIHTFRNHVGMRIGTMTIVKPTKERYNQTTVWEWQCDCGEIVNATLIQMKSYIKYLCPKCNDILINGYKWDITNLKIGSMTAISPTDEKEGTHIIWRWQCDCGYETFASLRQMKGCKSYLCSKCNDIHRNNIGLRIGTMTIAKPTKERYNRETVWEWQCDCGEFVNATKSQMRISKKYQCNKCSFNYSNLNITGLELEP